jgi:hypothetical protein
LSDRSLLALHYTLAHRQSAAAAELAQWVARALANPVFLGIFKELIAMTRIPQVSALTLVVAVGCWLSSAGCASSNDPSGNTGTAGAPSTTSSAGAGNTTAQGGGAGADGIAGSTTIAGTSGSLGGASSGGGATGTAGFSPLCSDVPLTAAMVAPTKLGACTATDTQLCYKTCGPQSTGYKTETCTNGAYVEGSTCSFPPDLDATCYKIPTTLDASCPTTTPQASQACTTTMCAPCNVGGMYLDSTGASKAGWCVCPMPGVSGTSKWSCASTNSWPCPNGKGC